MQEHFQLTPWGREQSLTDIVVGVLSESFLSNLAHELKSERQDLFASQKVGSTRSSRAKIFRRHLADQIHFIYSRRACCYLKRIILAVIE